MFDMHKLRTMLAARDESDEQEINRLRDRLTELQEENAHLRRLDETIRKNERLFERLLMRNREGILLVSQDLIILRLIHSSLGFKEVEVSGQPLLPFIHPDDVTLFVKSFAEVVSARAKSVSCDFRAGFKDGGWAWMRGDMTDLLDDPDIQAILLNVRIITEQKERTDAKETLESYRACSEYAMFTKGLDGVILDWNPGAQKIFGYSAEEAVGQNIALLVPPELLNEELSTRDRIARGDEVPAFRTLRVRKDGRSVEIQLRLSPVRDGCGVLKAIAHLSHVIG